MILSLCWTTIGRTENSCDKVLNKCVEVVEVQKDAIKSQEDTINSQKDYSAELEKKVKKVKSEGAKTVTVLGIANVILFILVLL